MKMDFNLMNPVPLLLKLVLVSLCFISVQVSAETKTDIADMAKTFAKNSDQERESILASLSLSAEQKEEIQNILLAGMQSLDVMNEQLGQFQADSSLLLSKEVQDMIAELKRQRVQLAELMSVEILSVLSPVQRSKLNLHPVLETHDQTDEPSVREYEI